MSSKDVAVSVRGLSKAYTIAHNAPKHTMVGEMLMHRLKHPFERPQKETFWALKDVEFDIMKGDVVGIIGRNGAGKSTLLKILSRITKPTTGQIDLYGRIGSLLEVGTGFHPELTGRENIFLNGAILGMRKREIERQFDAIVDFAGVEQFLDTPVKRYSSGMYVRLAFAVAAHLNPEILIVDEVLAVGDAAFQSKCMGKMQDVAQSGRTVLFVSHNMAAITNLCPKSIFMQSGKVAFVGETRSAIDHYLSQSNVSALEATVDIKTFRPSWARALITSPRILGIDGQEQTVFSMGSGIIFEMTFQAEKGQEIRNPMMGILINHSTFGAVCNVSTHLVNFKSSAVHDMAVMRCVMPNLPLLPGLYTVDTWLGDGASNIDCLTGYTSFSVEVGDVYGTGKPPYKEGILFVVPDFEMTQHSPQGVLAH